MNDFMVNINGYTLEYFDDQHLYLINGKIMPSITQILQTRFRSKYEGISPAILHRASVAGIAVHDAIEKYCQTGEVGDLVEVRNFRWLQKQYGFTVLANEVPVILFDGDDPVASGRLDLVIEMNGKKGLADIKRTSALDKEYLAYQLNLYRTAYQQSYGEKIEFLRGIHLRENVRKFVQIPIMEGIYEQL